MRNGFVTMLFGDKVLSQTARKSLESICVGFPGTIRTVDRRNEIPTVFFKAEVIVSFGLWIFGLDRLLGPTGPRECLFASDEGSV